jgi:hypothetical protein
MKKPCFSGKEKWGEREGEEEDAVTEVVRGRQGDKLLCGREKERKGKGERVVVAVDHQCTPFFSF